MERNDESSREQSHTASQLFFMRRLPVKRRILAKKDAPPVKAGHLRRS
ncbi:hypothetical protein [Brevibacillus massiliensis]|jgi:hypothetical protein|nr:hypothetical protein [Brevibacillus massiliensis]